MIIYTVDLCEETDVNGLERATLSEDRKNVTFEYMDAYGENLLGEGECTMVYQRTLFGIGHNFCLNVLKRWSL